MLCPKCGREMQEGFLQTNYDATMAWVSKPLPFGVGYFKKDTELISGDVGIGITGTPAHICKQCKLFVGDYSGKQ